MLNAFWVTTLYFFLGANSVLPVTSLSIADSLYNPGVFKNTEKFSLNLIIEPSFITEIEDEYEYAYDQFNSTIGKINTYSGQFSYVKPVNMLLGWTYKNFSFVAGYELYKSFEKRVDRDIYNRDNMRIVHEHFVSKGGISGIYAGFGIKNRRIGVGTRIVRYTYDLSLDDDTDLNSEKTGIEIFSNVNITRRIRVSTFFSPDVDFFKAHPSEQYLNYLQENFLNYHRLPDRKGLEIVYLPATDIVTMTSFTLMKEGESRYIHLDFKHNFLNVNAFEFGGGLFRDKNDRWGSFVNFGLGMLYKNLGFDTQVRYSFVADEGSSLCENPCEKNFSLVTLNLVLRYRL